MGLCGAGQEYGPDAAAIVSKRLEDEYSVRVNSYGTSRLRIVTHLQVLQDDVEVIVSGFEEILKTLPRLS